VRRHVGPSLPVLAHFFGIMRWDVERLTMEELNGYIKAANEWMKPTNPRR